MNRFAGLVIKDISLTSELLEVHDVANLLGRDVLQNQHTAFRWYYLQSKLDVLYQRGCLVQTLKENC